MIKPIEVSKIINDHQTREFINEISHFGIVTNESIRIELKKDNSLQIHFYLINDKNPNGSPSTNQSVILQDLDVFVYSTSNKEHQPHAFILFFEVLESLEFFKKYTTVNV